ncbi:MAG: phage portal protein [bacterium]|nr:phage portal protein [bacterium]
MKRSHTMNGAPPPIRYRRSRNTHAGGQVSQPRIRSHRSARRPGLNAYQSRYLKASQNSMMTSDWPSRPWTSEEMLKRHLRKVRARVRNASENDDWLKRFYRLLENNVVGDKGLVLQSQALAADGTPDTAARATIEALWKEHGRKGICDITGRRSMRDCQKQYLVTTAKDGEAVVQAHVTERNPDGIALQFLDTERVDVDHNEDLRNGHRICMGIELDEATRPLGYYIRTKSGANWENRGRHYKRIDAKWISHGYIYDDPEQFRGMPWAVSAIFRLHQLRGYTDASLIRARISATAGGFFTTSDDEQLRAGDTTNAVDDLIMDAEPGVFRQVPQNLQFQEWNPRYPQGEFPEFNGAILRSAAAGLGVSYHTLANDLRKVNYSSGKMGAGEDRAAYRTYQRYLRENFLDWYFHLWLGIQLARGRVVVDGETLHSGHMERLLFRDWVARSWNSIDPVKDGKGDEITVNNGYDTESSIIRNRGRDPEEVWIERAQEFKRKRAIEDQFELPPGTLSQSATAKPTVPPPPVDEPVTNKPADKVRALTRALRLNPRAVGFAQARIAAGRFDLESPWELTSKEEKALLETPGRYYLAEVPDQTGSARWRHPTGKIVDGEFVVYMSALEEIREVVLEDDAIAAAAGNLQALMESGEQDVAIDSDNEAEETDSSSNVDDDPKPDEVEPNFTEVGD